jgi:hypothetical protein
LKIKDNTVSLNAFKDFNNACGCQANLINDLKN